MARSSSSRPNRPTFPAVDDRLVAPESRFEIIDGKVSDVAPSDESHGTRHSEIAALLEAHVADGFDAAVDMLTRTSEKNDMAPDASIFPEARDPETGGRRIEEMAFEVLSTEKLSHAATKARALATRGVRRIFAIDVDRKRALAWSRGTNNWEILPADGAIEDTALAVPLPIAALVGAARADDAVARALIARKNPVIESKRREDEARGEARGEERGEKRGLLKGRADSIVKMLALRGIKVSKKAERRIRETTSSRQLDTWLARALTCRSIDELFKD